MEWLLSALGTGGLGPIFSGITGLVGGYLTKRENRKKAELDYAHELKMAEVDQKAAEFEFNAAVTLKEKEVDLAETEGRIAEDLIDAQSDADVARLEATAFANGLAEGHKPTGYPGVDKFRALTRPLITWSLYVFVAVIFYVLHGKVGAIVAEDTELLVKLYVYLVQSVIYLFIMAVSWWFMSRGEKSAKVIKNLVS